MASRGIEGLTDQELVAAARRGDRQAYGELVCRHWEGAVRVVTRMIGDALLAEDAAQDAFLRAWQRLHTYRPQYRFRNWIYSIAIHAALDLLRRERPGDSLEDADRPGDQPGPEQFAEDRERLRQVRQAVLSLPPASRAVLVLREYESLSYAEIASVLDIPLGTVMSRLNYARSQLRLALAGYLEET